MPENINITDDQLDKLAEYIVKKLLQKQKEEFVVEALEEELLGEMARLHTLLNLYESSEQYEKAALIKTKIDRVQERLKRLSNDISKKG